MNGQDVADHKLGMRRDTKVGVAKGEYNARPRWVLSVLMVVGGERIVSLPQSKKRKKKKKPSALFYLCRWAAVLENGVLRNTLLSLTT